MSIEQMRAFLKKTYPSKSYADRVDKMSDAQVTAIYNRILNTVRDTGK